ncbi:hypothetical protein MNBD_GAMMA24-91, partial [hydrothermal vent metagenome]
WGLLGDVLLRVPVVEAIGKRFPRAKITLVVDPAAVTVIENHPVCHEVLPFSRNKRRITAYILDFIRKILYLRNKKFDLSVNLYSGGSSPLVTRLIAARIRLGFDHTLALRKANNLLVKTPSFCGHWTRALGRTLEPLGIAANEVRRGSSFYCSDLACQFAHEFLAQMGQHYVAINLGARVPEKRWPVECYAKLATQIADSYGLHPLVFTNPGMEELVDEFALKYTGSKPYKRVPLVSLDKVGALLDQVFAMITGDTSLMHLAFAVKCPTLVLFTHTRPEVVEPDDCQHVACFIKDNNSLDECGQAYGMADIPVEYACQRFDLLYMQL